MQLPIESSKESFLSFSLSKVWRLFSRGNTIFLLWLQDHITESHFSALLNMLTLTIYLRQTFKGFISELRTLPLSYNKSCKDMKMKIDFAYKQVYSKDSPSSLLSNTSAGVSIHPYKRQVHICTVLYILVQTLQFDKMVYLVIDHLVLN